MRIIKIDYNNPDPLAIKGVAAAINKGKIAIVPGDAVYTIVADAFNAQAVEKVNRIKKRRNNKPFNLGLYCIEDIAKYGQFDPLIKEIVKRFPAEPFTFAVRRKDNVPGFLNPAHKTLGFRVPFNKVTSTLSRFHRRPVIGTSANISELRNTYSVDGLMEYFKKVFLHDVEPDIILDAGKLPTRRPSTVIELIDGRVNIVREGEIGPAVLSKGIYELKKQIKRKNTGAYIENSGH